MKKVLVIVGPTAIGKTNLSISLAKLFNGEIISGDSIQVYKGLDIGSGKITTKDMDNIKHYGIDILDNKDNYSVYDFQSNAREYINTIISNNKLPIVCGGTGLYIKALLYDYIFSDNISIDYSIYDNLSNQEIYNRLLIKDPKSLDTIHINNRQRLVRALALADNNKPKSKQIDKQEHKLIYDALIIGLTTDREQVYNRINNRVDIMFKEGLIEEVNNLINSGISFDNQCMQAIGYKEFKYYYNNELEIKEVKELIKRNSRRLAKKQYTWFNNQTKIKWYDINDYELLVNEVKLWMKN